MAIVFYISGHGFGHASRDVEIINSMTAPALEPLIIRSSVSPALLARTLRVPYDLRLGQCDTGIIQRDSVTHDDPATVTAALDFYRTFDARVEAELALLADLDVSLVVGDIAPLAFAVAGVLGARSIAVANFTWDWIYETHPGFLPDGRPVIALIRDCYRRADLALQLPFSGGFEVFDRVEPVPLVARRASLTADMTRSRLRLPEGRLVLLSFGGYGLPGIDLSSIDCRHDWTVVTTDRVTSDPGHLPHVHVIQENQLSAADVRYEDLVAAVDVVMTKPGYGILAECISTGTPLVYTSRGAFREYDVLVEGMAGLVRHEFISRTDLFEGRWRDALERVLGQGEPQRRIPVNGAEVAARIIDSAAAHPIDGQSGEL
jgi:hypothetical protein